MAASAATPSIRKAAIATAARSAVAGPGLTGSRTCARSRRRAARSTEPANEKRTAPDGPLPGSASPRSGAALRSTSSNTLACRGHGGADRRDVVGAERRRDLLGAGAEARRVAHRRRPRPAVEAVQERLREGAGDDLERGRVVRPVAVVPPRDVAVAEAVRGRRAVTGEAVHEPEPVLDGAGRCPRPRRSTARSRRRSASTPSPST